MSGRRFHHPEQHAPFEIASATEERIAWWLTKYPDDRRQSALIPALWLVQKQNGGWLSEPALRAVGDRLGMPYIRVYEVATFYTMFNLEPVGKFHFQLCGTTPCMIRGADRLKDVCEHRIGPEGQVSENGLFSWIEVECLGACVNAPMIQINDYYYEDLSIEALETIIDEFASGQTPAPGPYVKRQTSAPEGPPQTLTDETLFDGSRAKPLSAIPGAPQPAPAGETQKT
jgi:NADH-quinone oxidoreductase subunit E